MILDTGHFINVYHVYVLAEWADTPQRQTLLDHLSPFHLYVDAALDLYISKGYITHLLSLLGKLPI